MEKELINTITNKGMTVELNGNTLVVARNGVKSTDSYILNLLLFGNPEGIK